MKLGILILLITPLVLGVDLSEARKAHLKALGERPATMKSIDKGLHEILENGACSSVKNALFEACRTPVSHYDVRHAKILMESALKKFIALRCDSLPVGEDYQRITRTLRAQLSDDTKAKTLSQESKLFVRAVRSLSDRLKVEGYARPNLQWSDEWRNLQSKLTDPNLNTLAGEISKQLRRPTGKLSQNTWDLPDRAVLLDPDAIYPISSVCALVKDRHRDFAISPTLLVKEVLFTLSMAFDGDMSPPVKYFRYIMLKNIYDNDPIGYHVHSVRNLLESQMAARLDALIEGHKPEVSSYGKDRYVQNLTNAFMVNHAPLGSPTYFYIEDLDTFVSSQTKGNKKVFQVLLINGCPIDSQSPNSIEVGYPAGPKLEKLDSFPAQHNYDPVLGISVVRFSPPDSEKNKIKGNYIIRQKCGDQIVKHRLELNIKKTENEDLLKYLPQSDKINYAQMDSDGVRRGLILDTVKESEGKTARIEALEKLGFNCHRQGVVSYHAMALKLLSSVEPVDYVIRDPQQGGWAYGHTYLNVPVLGTYFDCRKKGKNGVEHQIHYLVGTDPKPVGTTDTRYLGFRELGQALNKRGKQPILFAQNRQRSNIEFNLLQLAYPRPVQVLVSEHEPLNPATADIKEDGHWALIRMLIEGKSIEEAKEVFPALKKSNLISMGEEKRKNTQLQHFLNFTNHGGSRVYSDSRSYIQKALVKKLVEMGKYPPGLNFSYNAILELTSEIVSAKESKLSDEVKSWLKIISTLDKQEKSEKANYDDLTGLSKYFKYVGTRSMSYSGATRHLMTGALQAESQVDPAHLARELDTPLGRAVVERMGQSALPVLLIALELEDSSDRSGTAKLLRANPKLAKLKGLQRAIYNSVVRNKRSSSSDLIPLLNRKSRTQLLKKLKTEARRRDLQYSPWVLASNLIGLAKLDKSALEEYRFLLRNTPHEELRQSLLKYYSNLGEHAVAMIPELKRHLSDPFSEDYQEAMKGLEVLEFEVDDVVALVGKHISVLKANLDHRQGRYNLSQMIDFLGAQVKLGNQKAFELLKDLATHPELPNKGNFVTLGSRARYALSQSPFPVDSLLSESRALLKKGHLGHGDAHYFAAMGSDALPLYIEEIKQSKSDGPKWMLLHAIAKMDPHPEVIEELLELELEEKLEIARTMAVASMNSPPKETALRHLHSVAFSNDSHTIVLKRKVPVREQFIAAVGLLAVGDERDQFRANRILRKIFSTQKGQKLNEYEMRRKYEKAGLPYRDGTYTDGPFVQKLLSDHPDRLLPFVESLLSKSEKGVPDYTGAGYLEYLPQEFIDPIVYAVLKRHKNSSAHSQKVVLNYLASNPDRVTDAMKPLIKRAMFYSENSKVVEYAAKIIEEAEEELTPEQRQQFKSFFGYDGRQRVERGGKYYSVFTVFVYNNNKKWGEFRVSRKEVGAGMGLREGRVNIGDKKLTALADNMDMVSRPKMTVVDGKLYVVWLEQYGLKKSVFRAAQYNGNDDRPDWTLVKDKPTLKRLGILKTPK